MQLIPQLYTSTKQNVRGEEITDHVLKGSVSYDPDRALKWALSLDVNDVTVVTPYVEFLAPFLTVVYDDGVEVTSQLGLYAVMPPTQEISQQQRSVTLDGRDLTWLLSVDVFDQGYTVAAGTNVISAVTTILSGAGFTRRAFTPSSAVTSGAVSWKPGATKLTVINDLLTSIGYYTLTMRKDGVLSSQPYTSIVNPTVNVTYDTTDATARVKVVRTIKLDSTPDRIANKVVVVKDNASQPPLVVTKVNSNPLSPTSTVALGITITKVVQNSQVVDAAAATVLATRTLETASMAYNRLTLITTPDVDRDINEVYQLHVVDAQGQVVADGVWHCRGWSIGFTPSDGMMTHNLSNIDAPPMDV